MKTKTRAPQPVKTQLQSSVIYYLIGVMFGLPLIFTDGYFNITETKSIYFHIISIALIAFVVSGGGKKKASDGEAPSREGLNKKAELSATDIAMAAFCGVMLISCIFAKYSDCWLGLSSRYQGFYTIVIYTVVYFIVSRNFTSAQRFLLSSVLAFSIVCILGVLHCYGIDILGLYNGIGEGYTTSFLSTIGNINFYSSYMCLLMPLVVCGFCLSVGKISRAVYTAALILGAFGMMVTSSESFVVGFGSSLLIMPLFFYSRPHRLKRFLLSIIIIVLSSQTYMLIYNLSGKGNIAVSRLLKILVNPYISAAIILGCALALLIVHKFPDKLRILKVIYPLCLIVFVLTICICFVLANTVGLPRFNGAFKITSEWGTYRGKIWRFCAKTYLYEYSLKEKLLGTGLETLHKVTASAKLFERKSLDQAHNEYLQYLMTTGLAGLTAYLGVIATTIYTVAKKLKESTLALALLTGLVAYWMQATVNIAQPFTTPIVYIYIACIAGMANQADRMKRKN
mgnify:CR=1 FL=1